MKSDLDELDKVEEFISIKALSIYYPVVDGEIDEIEALPPLPLASDGEVILVCEDDPAVRRVTTRTLRSAGYHALEAENGAHALQVASSHGGKIDLLVTDVVMPEMNGPALAEAMLEAHHSLRVLFVSGYAAELVDRQQARTRGHGFLEKPFNSSMLVRRVHEMLTSPAAGNS